MKNGEDFELMLTPDQAYGEHMEEHVLDLDKQIFSVNGKFDSEHIIVDAIVPLQNEDGNRFNGHILEITEDNVKVDLNHPLAGKTLKFVGSVTENRDATNEEIGKYMNMINGTGGCNGCEGGCEDGCEGDCGDDKKDGGCCGCH